MAKRRIEQLDDRTVKKLTAAGSYADGQGLYLTIGPSGGKSWVVRYQFDGKRRRMGLGGYPDIGLDQARERRSHWRRIWNGSIESNTPRCDPLEAKRQIEAAHKAAKRKLVTFDEIAAKYIDANRPSWSNPKHAKQWESTLATYASPVIGSQHIADIDTDDVMRVLEPIWTTKTETATRIRGRIEKVIDYAKARKLRDAENPARWRGHLDALLAIPSKVAKVENFPSLPYSRIGAFIAALRERPSNSAYALEFLILTNTRTGDVIEADWAEIDLHRKLWIIPEHRLKTRKEHSIPLSDRAIELLDLMAKQFTSGLIFRNPKGDQLSNVAMANVIKRMNGVSPTWVNDTGRAIVPHGFRSTFRVWAGERTAYSRELIEFAMAHQLKDKAEASYHRSTLPEKRRNLMEDWAARLNSPDHQNAEVIPIGQAISN
jgi:integrase